MNTELIDLAEQFMPYIDLITPRYRQIVLDYVLQGGTSGQYVFDTLGWAATTLEAVPNPLDDAIHSFRWAVYSVQDYRPLRKYAIHISDAHASLKQFILTQT